MYAFSTNAVIGIEEHTNESRWFIAYYIDDNVRPNLMK